MKAKALEVEKAYLKKDAELAKADDIEINGHPFITCTNSAKWMKKTFFPKAKIMGFYEEDNPESEIGQAAGGHDFLVIDNRYILDMWYKHIENHEDAPILIDMETQKDLLKKYYGDPKTWKKVA